MSCKAVVVGAGEVGHAVWSVCQDSDKYDPDKGFFCKEEQYDVLLVCIPYSDKFVSIVRSYQNKFNASSTIIFSSVPIGTSRQLNAVHSPVEGKHPNLVDGLERFDRWVGGADVAASEYLTKWFGRVVVVDTPEETEFLKLRSTTLYGVTIEYARYTDKICKERGFDYENVLQYDDAYNELYESTPFSRSLLSPPTDAGIKGHCILENAILLNESFPHPLVQNVLSLGKHLDVVAEEKPYLNKTWLYCEYVGKGKTTAEIAQEQGCTPENISAIMSRRRIPKRIKEWSVEEDAILTGLVTSLTFKEIVTVLKNRSYAAIRTRAIKLGLNSCYRPEFRDVETRKKISASLQHVNLEDWVGFSETDEVKKLRSSCEYKKWKSDTKDRDSYTCQDCGSHVDAILHVHHIIPIHKDFSKSLDYDNGVTLCFDCHWERHRA